MPSAIKNRKVAFDAIFVSLKQLKTVANNEGLDYEALKKEAQRLPAIIFSLRDKIVERVEKRIEMELGK